VTEVASLAQRRAWADLSEAAGYELLAAHASDGAPRSARRFGGCIACPTGRSASFFNPILILEPTTAADLREAGAWMRDQGAPLSLRIRDDLETEALRGAATELGLEREEWVEPAMVLWPLRSGADHLPAALSIEEATSSSIDRFYEASSSGFLGSGDSGVAFMRDLFPPDIAADPDVRLFGGFLGDDPIASSVAIRSGPVVGIYAVGTAERARRRGIGTAMTWRAIEAGRDWGCEAATLQASAMGEPVYRAMGFESVASYVHWSRPAASLAFDASSGT
jgi:GNAT superfamily N-acetyltransferase